jgi:ParB-like chromosome segregation protein Spo0J
MSDDVKWKGNDDLRSMLVPISSLHNDPENARKHDERNLGAIRSSLLHFGQQKPIVVDGNNRVIAGNGTLESAIAAGWSHIARVRSDLNDPVSQRAFAIADNRTAELAGWDEAALAESLRSIGDDLASVAGFTLKEVALIVALDDGDATAGLRRTGVPVSARYGVVVECADEAAQKDAYDRLTSMGFTCKVVNV